MPSTDIYLSSGDGPMWMLHWPTFTLALLHLQGGPQGEHLLHIRSDRPVPDDALTGFACLLDEFSPGASANLLTVSRPDANLHVYESRQVLMAPASPGAEGFVAVATQPPSVAIGWLPNSGPIGPLWESRSVPTVIRRNLIESLTTYALANLRVEDASPLDDLSAATWLNLPDSFPPPPGIADG